ncbi:MAG: DNA repair protein RecO [Kiritimatiellae bacterium]|nr:DNA repair protein RecO [Kiritimatiellia bacterium]MDW8457535.1 DNA repair protein RecO [Verrucomicrobiota bacterium]
MILKTPAIALRRYPFSETSLVITWLSPDAGRLHTLIKGAFRPKSLFFGAADLFYTCELVYHDRGPEGLAIAREISPLRHRTPLRSDWRACAVASYLCGVVAKIVPRGATRTDLYHWLEGALDELVLRGGSLPRLCSLELRLARVLGLGPRLERCIRCESSLPVSGYVWFSAPNGGWFCENCVVRLKGPRPAPIPSAVIHRLIDWERAGDALIQPIPPSTIDAANRLVGSFMAHHLDCPAPMRMAAVDILSRQPPPPVDLQRTVR